MQEERPGSPETALSRAPPSLDNLHSPIEDHPPYNRDAVPVAKEPIHLERVLRYVHLVDLPEGGNPIVSQSPSELPELRVFFRELTAKEPPARRKQHLPLDWLILFHVLSPPFRTEPIIEKAADCSAAFVSFCARC